MEEEKNVKELEAKLALAEKERDEYLGGWKRAKADLINAKKEWTDQIKDLGDFAKIEIVKQFLPVMDALENAKEIEGWREIKKLVYDVFNKSGVEEIEALGKKFDPMYHEAVGEGAGNDNEIIEVLQKGYRVNNQVIRAAKVKVGKYDANIQMDANDTNR